MPTDASAFISMEFLELFSLPLSCVVLYYCISIAMVIAVRKLGPVSIGKYRIESAYDDSTGTSNVVYRIVAPVVANYFFLLIVAASATILGLNIQLSVRWLPILFYWINLLILKIGIHRLSMPLWATFLEICFSIGLSIYFDWAVVCRFPQLGLLAIDQSNIGFQVAVMLFFAVVQIILSATLRSKYGYLLGGRNYRRSYSSSVYPTEQTLFSYKRRFDKFLPNRFHEDLALHVLFYSIMFIEDANRPHYIRKIEAFLARVGRAKTTGIMQQKNPKGRRALSDEESVQAAIPQIEEIWDKYLKLAAKRKGNPFGFFFTETAYRYNYGPVSLDAGINFSKIYGDYCGTRELSVNHIFFEVESFFTGEEFGFEPEIISVQKPLFPAEASWFPGETLFWTGPFSIHVQNEAAVPDRALTGKEGTRSNISVALKLLQQEGHKPLEVIAVPGFPPHILYQENGSPSRTEGGWVDERIPTMSEPIC